MAMLQVEVRGGTVNQGSLSTPIRRPPSLVLSFPFCKAKGSDWIFPA